MWQPQTRRLPRFSSLMQESMRSSSEVWQARIGSVSCNCSSTTSIWTAANILSEICRNVQITA